MKHFTIYILLILIMSHCCFFNGDEYTIISGINSFPISLIPSQYSTADEIQIFSQIYETLLILDDDGKTLIPHLAKSWRCDDDNKIFTFYLNANVTFHNGNRLSAEDVKYSFEKQIATTYFSYIYHMIESIDIIDSLTLTIKLKHPYAIFPYTLAVPYGLVVISKDFAQQMDNRLSSYHVGTGPYRLNEIKKNDCIILESNPDYWKEINTIKTIIFKYDNNRSQLEQAIKTSAIDILFMVTGYSIDRLKWQGTIDYYVQSPLDIHYLGFNSNHVPFNDIRVRKAVLHALNRMN